MAIEVELSQQQFLNAGGIFARALIAKQKNGELAKEYEYREYPKMLRLNPREVEVPHIYYIGAETSPRTEYITKTVYDEIIVHSEEDEERVLSGGKTSGDLEQERQNLIARARVLGIKVDTAWSAVRLKRELGDKLDAPEPADKMAALSAELANLRKMADMQAEIDALRAQLGGSSAEGTTGSDVTAPRQRRRAPTQSADDERSAA